jgi:cell division protein FtsL
MKQKRKITVYGLFFLIIIIASIISLIVTIQTIPVSKEISLVNNHIRVLKEENQGLLFKISSATSYEILLEKAKFYNMEPTSPEKFIHIRIKSHD